MRNSRDALQARLLAVFREEAAEHLRQIAGAMAAIDAATDEAVAKASVAELFRASHTLKGAARSLSITTIETVCHDLEDRCSDLVKGRVAVDAETRAGLRALTDRLSEVAAARLSVPATAAGPAAAPAAAEPRVEPSPSPKPVGEGPRFVRVDNALVRQLGLMAEELTAPRLAGSARVADAERLLAEIVAARRNAAPRSEAAADDRGAGRALQAAEQAAHRLVGALAEDRRSLRAVTDTLIAGLREARMMPAGELFAAFPAMVAELAREVGKAIRWEARGTDVMIDREVAEVVKDPLIHVVRNAIDHGIEPSAVRVASGKAATGTITVTVAPADGGRIAIEVADDGAGIDVAAVREAAIRGRLVGREEATAMGDDAAIDLVFQSMFSTRTAITPISGRGLGLAIARERAERLGGDVRVRSAAGRGTVVRFEVPAALASFRGLAVRAGGATWIIPGEAVERTVAVNAADHDLAMVRGILMMDREPTPCGSLADVLGLPAHAETVRTLHPGVLLAQGGKRGVVVVDDVLGDGEVLVKELRPPLLRVRHVLAAGVLGSGQLAPILRPADVLAALVGRRRKANVPEPALPRRSGPYRLLVVDDSLTTRAMEVALLEAAGYDVQAAADGLEAWAALQAGDFDAVVSDVDMPNMNGFDLTERIRGDPRLGRLPIVLVTALERREDHDRGLRLGANAYMMKSAFDQSMLIDLVRRVI